jgi:hypothetical protein
MTDTVQFNCPNCNFIVKAPAATINELALCPNCQASIQIPSLTLPTPAAAPPIVSDWHVRTPGGQVFGPITKQQLDGWLQEGRLNAAVDVCPIGTDQWTSAASIYPQLGPGPSAAESPTASPPAQAIVDPLMAHHDRGMLGEAPLSPTTTEATNPARRFDKKPLVLAAAGLAGLVTLVIFLLAGGNKPKTVDGLAETVLNSIRDSDPDALVKLLASGREFADFFRSQVEPGQRAMLESPEFNNQLGRQRAREVSTFPERQQEFRRQQARDWGFSWENVSFKEARYELNEKNGVKFIDELQIHFAVEGSDSEFFILLSGVVNVGGGWRITNFPETIVRDRVATPLPGLSSVEGVVTYEDKPLANAHVVFAPNRSSGLNYAHAKTDANGKFTLVTVRPDYEGQPVRVKGAIAAEFQVMIVKRESPTDSATDSSDTGDETEDTLITDEYLELVGDLEEDGSGGNPNLKSLINGKFSETYSTPLKASISPSSDRNLNINIYADGTGTVR